MKNSVCSFVLMLLCVVLVASAAIFGIEPLGVLPITDNNAVSKGLDLVGGSSVTYKAVPDTEDKNFDMAEALDTVDVMLRQRLDTLGQTEATISPVGDDKLRVEIPGIKNPEEALEKLGSTAKLTFVNSSGEVILEGEDVKEATSRYGYVDQNSLEPENHVVLTFTKEGREKFAAATEAAAALKETGGNYISIMLDTDEISKPYVEKKIDDDSCVITNQGGFEEEESVYLAELISAGKLPVELEQSELRAVGPTLGTEALSTSVFAGAIGILLVMVFMILIYRFPGFISAVALVAYTSIFAIIINVCKISLSLPGIAGIILTIGMAVDANVVIYERIKEELNTGKSNRAAVRSGFKNAFTAIFDSNITTIIAAAVLWYYGTGAVRGFAITLFIGVVISLFTALFVTRVLLVTAADMGIGRWLLGAKRKSKKVEGDAQI